MAVTACAVQPLSGPPQLIDTTLGLWGLVVRGLADGVDEALVGVGREVDGQRGVRRARTRHLNVQRHLSVGVRVLARRVNCAIHQDRDDLRWRESHGLEGGPGVGVGDAAAELDDGDGLAPRRPRPGSRRAWRPRLVGAPRQPSALTSRTDWAVATGRWSSPSTASTRSAISPGAESSPERARKRPAAPS